MNSFRKTTAPSENWPTICVPGCLITDDDIQFNSDLAYFRALLSDISELSHTARYANRIPISMSDDLDSAITAVKAIR